MPNSFYIYIIPNNGHSRESPIPAVSFFSSFIFFLSSYAFHKSRSSLMVASTLIFRISSAPVSRGFCSSTTKSAFFPGVTVPFSFSSKYWYAPLTVTALSASPHRNALLRSQHLTLPGTPVYGAPQSLHHVRHNNRAVLVQGETDALLQGRCSRLMRPARS